MGWTCLSCNEWFDIYHEVNGEVRFCPICGGGLRRDPIEDEERENELNSPPKDDFNIFET